MENSYALVAQLTQIRDALPRPQEVQLRAAYEKIGVAVAALIQFLMIGGGVTTFTHGARTNGLEFAFIGIVVLLLAAYQVYAWTFRLHLNPDRIESSSAFGTRKIYLRDIGSIQIRPGYGEYNHEGLTLRDTNGAALSVSEVQPGYATFRDLLLEHASHARLEDDRPASNRVIQGK
jgi:hypothetical protein